MLTACVLAGVVLVFAGTLLLIHGLAAPGQPVAYMLGGAVAGCAGVDLWLLAALLRLARGVA